jgi:hypothetical protein
MMMIASRQNLHELVASRCRTEPTCSLRVDAECVWDVVRHNPHFDASDLGALDEFGEQGAQSSRPQGGRSQATFLLANVTPGALIGTTAPGCDGQSWSEPPSHMCTDIGLGGARWFGHASTDWAHDVRSRRAFAMTSGIKASGGSAGATTGRRSAAPVG